MRILNIIVGVFITTMGWLFMDTSLVVGILICGLGGFIIGLEIKRP